MVNENGLNIPVMIRVLDFTNMPEGSGFTYPSKMKIDMELVSEGQIYFYKKDFVQNTNRHNIHFMRTWQATAKACCNDISTLFSDNVDAIRVLCFKDTPKLGDAIRWVLHILSRLQCINPPYLSGKVNKIIKDCTINTRKAIEEVCKMNYHVFTALDKDYEQVRAVYYSQYLLLYRTHRAI